MKNRFKLHLSNSLNDSQIIQPRFFRQQIPKTGATLDTHPFQFSCVELKSPRRTTLKSIAHKSFKKTSLDEAPIESDLQSAKQQLRQGQFRQVNQIQTTNNDDQIFSQLPSALKNQKFTTQGRRKKKFQLKQIVKRQKINNICSKFIQKLKRNNINSKAINYKGFQNTQKQSIFYQKGFQIKKAIDNTIAFLSIIQIASLFFAYTLAIVFPEVSNAPFIGTLQFFSIAFYLFEIFYNCITVKVNSGKKLQSFIQILKFYLLTNMIVDLISLLILLVDCSGDYVGMEYLRLFIVTKLPQCLEKMEKLQAFFIKNYYNQQYWSLTKVFLFNFCFAHLLAILLTAMANMNQQNNWQLDKNIQHSSWFEKYAWSYYWGTNIMLTIGFGDIFATTYQQAICLIFIEIFSVMCLAYNINSVGTLISNIRSQDIQKSKNYKTFKQLSDKYELTDELSQKINHYIQESVNIRKKFNLQQQNGFLQKLPSDLKKDYLKESNRSIFCDLTFFGSLIDKTLYAFAENIEMSISHPEQTLRRLDDDYNLLILRQGEIGFTSKRRNYRVKVSDVKKPFLLGLQFLTRKRPIYEIKSLQYSVIYYLEYDNLIKNLKQTQMDYDHFCFLRDKNKTIMDQFQVYPCQYCPNKRHTKFTCPKLHYSPLKQLIIYKQQHREKTNKNIRIYQPQHRISTPKQDALLHYKIINKIAQQQNAKKNAKQKTSNPFLDQLSRLKRIRSQSKRQQMENTTNQLLLKYTSEIIKLEFNRFKISQNFQDQVWIINCDKMKNYKDYFPENNPCTIQQTFSIEQRLKFETNSKLQSNKFIFSKSPTLASFAKSGTVKPSSASIKFDQSYQI